MSEQNGASGGDGKSGKKDVTNAASELPEYLGKNNTFAWPSTASVLCQLLPLLQHVTASHLMSLATRASGRALAFALSQLMTQSFVTVGTLLYPSYSPAATPELLARNKASITALRLIIRAVAYVWPNEINATDLLSMVCAAVIHLDRGVRAAAASLLGLFTRDSSRPHVRAAAVNELSLFLSSLPAVSGNLDLPQALLACPEAVAVATRTAERLRAAVPPPPALHSTAAGAASAAGFGSYNSGNGGAQSASVGESGTGVVGGVSSIGGLAAAAAAAELAQSSLAPNATHEATSLHFRSGGGGGSNSSGGNSCSSASTAAVRHLRVVSLEPTGLDTSLIATPIKGLSESNGSASNGVSAANNSSYVEGLGGFTVPDAEDTVFAMKLNSTISGADRAVARLQIDVIRGTDPSEAGSEVTFAVLAQLQRLLTIWAEDACQTVCEAAEVAADLRAQRTDAMEQSHWRNTLNSASNSSNSKGTLRKQTKAYAGPGSFFGTGPRLSADGDAAAETPQERAARAAAADRVCLGEIARAGRAVQTQLKGLAGLDWPGIEASVAVSLTSASGGVRVLSLETLSLLHALASMHVRLIDALAQLENKREQVLAKWGGVDPSTLTVASALAASQSNDSQGNSHSGAHEANASMSGNSGFTSAAAAANGKRAFGSSRAMAASLRRQSAMHCNPLTSASAQQHTGVEADSLWSLNLGNGSGNTTNNSSNDNSAANASSASAGLTSPTAARRRPPPALPGVSANSNNSSNSSSLQGLAAVATATASASLASSSSDQSCSSAMGPTVNVDEAMACNNISGLAHYSSAFLPPGRHMIATLCASHGGLRKHLLSLTQATPLPSASQPNSHSQSGSSSGSSAANPSDIWWRNNTAVASNIAGKSASPTQSASFDDEDAEGDCGISALSALSPLDPQGWDFLLSLASATSLEGQNQWTLAVGYLFRSALTAVLSQQVKLQVSNFEVEKHVSLLAPSASAAHDRFADGAAPKLGVSSYFVKCSMGLFTFLAPPPTATLLRAVTYAKTRLSPLLRPAGSAFAAANVTALTTHRVAVAPTLLPSSIAAASNGSSAAGLVQALDSNAPPSLLPLTATQVQQQQSDIYGSTSVSLLMPTADSNSHSNSSNSVNANANANSGTGVTVSSTASVAAVSGAAQGQSQSAGQSATHNGAGGSGSSGASGSQAQQSGSGNGGHTFGVVHDQSDVTLTAMRNTAVLMAITCIVPSKALQLPLDYIVTAPAFYNALNATNSDYRANADASASASATVDSLLSPHLFRDGHSIYQDLTLLLLSTSLHVRRIAATALGAAHPLAVPIVLHGMLELEKAVYTSTEPFELLPPFAQNIFTGINNGMAAGGAAATESSSSKSSGKDKAIVDKDRKVRLAAMQLTPLALTHSGNGSGSSNNNVDMLCSSASGDSVALVNPSSGSGGTAGSNRFPPCDPTGGLAIPLIKGVLSLSGLGPNPSGSKSASAVRKLTDDLRIGLAHVYRLLSEHLDAQYLDRHLHVKARFFIAINEHFSFFSQLGSDLRWDLLALRTDFCIILRRVAFESLSATLLRSRLLPALTHSSASCSDSSSSSGSNSSSSKKGVSCAVPFAFAFTTELRSALFEFMLSWCGLGPATATASYHTRIAQHKQELLARVKSKDTALRATLEAAFTEQVAGLQHETLHAMASLLGGPNFDGTVLALLQEAATGGPATAAAAAEEAKAAAAAAAAAARGGKSSSSWWGRKGKREVTDALTARSAVFSWVNALLLSPAPAVRDVGFLALHVFISSNKALLPAFINQCYAKQAALGRRYFLVVARVILLCYSGHDFVDNALGRKSLASSPTGDPMGTGSYSSFRERGWHIPLDLVTHLAINKLGDASYSVRSMALRLLPLLEQHLSEHATALGLSNVAASSDREQQQQGDREQSDCEQEEEQQQYGGLFGWDADMNYISSHYTNTNNSNSRSSFYVNSHGNFAADNEECKGGDEDDCEAKSAAEAADTVCLQDDAYGDAARLRADEHYLEQQERYSEQQQQRKSKSKNKKKAARSKYPAPSAARVRGAPEDVPLDCFDHEPSAILTSHLPDTYLKVQVSWSRRLAGKFSHLALPLLQEVAVRIHFVATAAEQQQLLEYTRPWLQHIVLTSAEHCFPPKPSALYANPLSTNGAAVDASSNNSQNVQFNNFVESAADGAFAGPVFSVPSQSTSTCVILNDADSDALITCLLGLMCTLGGHCAQQLDGLWTALVCSTFAEDTTPSAYVKFVYNPLSVSASNPQSNTARMSDSDGSGASASNGGMEAIFAEEEPSSNTNTNRYALFFSQTSL